MSIYTEDELRDMNRSELDEVAEGLGLDPADYGNKSDEADAILEAQETDVEIATTTVEAEEEPVESPGFAGLDIATLQEDDGAKKAKPILGPDEHFLLTSESWVILGEDESVPDWAVGNPAAVISAPVAMAKDDNGDGLYPYTDPDAVITVRERTQGATMSVPLQSVQKLSVTGGRSNVVNHP